MRVQVKEVPRLYAERPGLRMIPFELKSGGYEVKEGGILSLAAPADMEVALIPHGLARPVTADLNLRITGQTGNTLRTFLGNWLQSIEQVQIGTLMGGS